MDRFSKSDFTERMVRAAEETAGRPIRNASLFYSLYYLSEIEGVDEASYDLFQVTDHLYDGLYAYGLHTITLEMQHIGRWFEVNGEPFAEATEQQIVDHFEEAISDKNQLYAIRAAMRFFHMGADLIFSPKVPWKSFAFIQGDLELADNPIQWVETAKEMYGDYKEGRIKMSPGEEDQWPNYTGWVGGYGGPGWEAVAKHILRRQELTKIAWVDQSWSVQHNGGNWIDKIDMDPREYEVIADVASDGFFIGDNSADDLMFEDLLRALNNHLLDANLEGDMETVFRYAEHYQDEIDINLSRWRKRTLY
jgi:hypothetical protein